MNPINGSADGPAAPCCQAAIGHGDRFCSGCGTKVSPPAAGVDRCPKLELVVTRDQGRDQVLPLHTRTTIGKSSECDIRIADDPYLSQQHAQIEVAGDRVFLEDMGSSNGSFVRAAGPILLRPGDQLILGSTVIRLRETTQIEAR